MAQKKDGTISLSWLRTEGAEKKGGRATHGNGAAIGLLCVFPLGDIFPFLHYCRRGLCPFLEDEDVSFLGSHNGRALREKPRERERKKVDLGHLHIGNRPKTAAVATQRLRCPKEDVEIFFFKRPLRGRPLRALMSPIASQRKARRLARPSLFFSVPRLVHMHPDALAQEKKTHGNSAILPPQHRSFDVDDHRDVQPSSPKRGCVFNAINLDLSWIIQQ
nr:hypothetical protein [Pandoravirus massiliensis]